MAIENNGHQTNASLIRAHVLVRGNVQGVGFRPFVYRVATLHNLAGCVLNSTEGVEIEVEGIAGNVNAFLSDLEHKAPPAASIHKMATHFLPPAGYSSFIIETSKDRISGFPLVAPDLATCPECLSDLFNPRDRRYLYPFTNCTNCGPRFTIVEGVPYDRPKTTMKTFDMCPPCQAEYYDPANRRFHAQPNACPTCGPSLWLCTSPRSPHPNPITQGEGSPILEYRLQGPQSATTAVGEDGSVFPRWGGEADPIAEARRLLKSGAILAIKGLGGFHLACDATNADAVLRLRQRKHRAEKPFAIMVRDLESVKRLCCVSQAEAQLLSSVRRPIVLLQRRLDSSVVQDVAPRNKCLGVMLPYTPIHHLLLEPSDGIIFDALVMTSGNLSEEPIARENDEALYKLRSLADAFLMHDRPIYVRCDDSITQVFEDKESLIRRSRGYAPLPVHLASESKPVLACGAQLKSSFCIAEDNYAFLSQHIGDLENQETLDFFVETIEHFIRVFNLRPQIVAYDLHPDYLSTRYAQSFSEKGAGSGWVPSTSVGVQHHHAHIASCMAENGLREQVIGVAFDGTGYGLDGAIWGGEFLFADLLDFKRAAHLRYVSLPGGQASIRKPYRYAISHVLAAFGEDLPQIGFLKSLDPGEVEVIKRQIARGINTPMTSSCGRLFDAVSALLGIRGEISYEGQAAIELEMAAEADIDGVYEFELIGEAPIQIDAKPVIRSIVDDLIGGVEREVIAGKFHNSVAQMVVEVCGILRDSTGLNKVCLSGGVFQNRLLLSRTLNGLRERGFDTFIHHLVPCNDGGISLGQAVIASEMVKVRDC